MADDDIPWKCSGCGVVTPGRVRQCECATNCVFTRDPYRSELKLGAAYWGMTLQELRQKRDEIDAEIRRRVLGNPRVSVHVGPDGVTVRGADRPTTARGG